MCDHPGSSGDPMKNTLIETQLTLKGMVHFVDMISSESPQVGKFRCCCGVYQCVTMTDICSILIHMKYLKSFKRFWAKQGTLSPTRSRNCIMVEDLCCEFWIHTYVGARKYVPCRDHSQIPTFCVKSPMFFHVFPSTFIVSYHILSSFIPFHSFFPRFFLFRNRVPAAASWVVSCRAASALIMASRSAKWAAMRLVGASGDGRRYLLWNIWGYPNSWMVHGKSCSSGWFRDARILGNPHISHGWR